MLCAIYAMGIGYVPLSPKALPTIKQYQAKNLFEAWYEYENGCKPGAYASDPLTVPLYKAPGIERLWQSYLAGFMDRPRAG